MLRLRLRRYVLRRLLTVIPVILGVTLIAFTLENSTSFPAAPYINEYMSPEQIQAVIHEHGFDQPLYIRYFYFLNDLVHGDLGYSQSVGLSVTNAIQIFFPATVELSITALIIAILLGIPLGTRSALRRGKATDYASRLVSLTGMSIPPMILAFILQYIFFFELAKLGLPFLPATGRLSTTVPYVTGFALFDSLFAANPGAILDWLSHLVLPAATLSLIILAPVMRIVRASLLEVMNKEFVTAARAKGLSEPIVTYKHAMRSALLPVITNLGYLFGILLSGSVITETVFSWPGVGRWVTFAITSGDVAAVTGFTLIMGLVYVFVNTLVDITYAWIDPRIKLGGA